jgi:20S proteasome alpha/beta subunit
MVNNTKIQLEQSELAVDKMTLLLGARCTDGVVLAADRKFAGRRPVFEDKITGELKGMLTGFSGDYGSFIVFTAGLRKYVNDITKSQIKDLADPAGQTSDLGADLDSIIWEINRIKSELKHKFYLLMAVSGSYFKKDKKSRLYEFDYFDGCIPINNGYEVLGSGADHCSYILKRYFRNNDMKMEEFAQLADFAIRFVSNEKYIFTNHEVGLDPTDRYFST